MTWLYEAKRVFNYRNMHFFSERVTTTVAPSLSKFWKPGVKIDWKTTTDVNLKFNIVK